MTRKIITAMFHHALQQGNCSWDVAISKVTSVVLTVALESGVGDVTKHCLDEHSLPYLCWNDITMTLEHRTGIENLTARILVSHQPRALY